MYIHQQLIYILFSKNIEKINNTFVVNTAI
jgi:hypothetical protein